MKQTSNGVATKNSASLLMNPSLTADRVVLLKAVSSLDSVSSLANSMLRWSRAGAATRVNSKRPLEGQQRNLAVLWSRGCCNDSILASSVRSLGTTSNFSGSCCSSAVPLVLEAGATAAGLTGLLVADLVCIPMFKLFHIMLNEFCSR